MDLIRGSDFFKPYHQGCRARAQSRASCLARTHRSPQHVIVQGHPCLAADALASYVTLFKTHSTSGTFSSPERVACLLSSTLEMVQHLSPK